MTTIAWDGHTLAADRRVNFGSVSDMECTKIVKNKKGHLAAASGSSSLAAGFRRWFLEGEKGEPVMAKDGQDATGFIIRKPGKVEMYDIAGWYEAETDKFAVGSGCELALGALRSGGDAIAAVGVAMMHDGYTGGKVDALELGK